MDHVEQWREPLRQRLAGLGPAGIEAYWRERDVQFAQWAAEARATAVQRLGAAGETGIIAAALGDQAAAELAAWVEPWCVKMKHDAQALLRS